MDSKGNSTIIAVIVVAVIVIAAAVAYQQGVFNGNKDNSGTQVNLPSTGGSNNGY